MNLNPDIAAYLQLVNAARASGKVAAMHEMSPEQARAAFDQSSVMMSLGGDDSVEVQDLELPTRDGVALAARLYRPAPARPGKLDAAVVYLHGGGYVVGSLDSHDALCRDLALDCGLPVLSVDYRLAPQWQFPTASEDAEDAWAAVVAQAQALGLDAQRLVAAGDSVGGSLAAQVGTPQALPRLRVLIYPVTDATSQSASLQRFASGHLLETATLQWFYQQYAPQAADRSDPRLSPLLGAVANPQVPVCLVLADCDPLYDQGLAYARHLQAAGVTVQLQVYAGMVHDFLRMDAIADEAGEARQAIAEAIRVAVGEG
ncbi:alpha/beta hydrolase [Pseudomonas xanthosomatis]|uniref:alpha/beta hydrolase n=1 Tax=Pseudomonas xanthosomatis TaxID=2842356 RepID=UPI001C3D08C8|nr:alpha/beta hydrolase [Pseudomonas xanthosomatis]QXH44124.1 alpha/beta hydrolase [Pseudomonas xanthosomatis]